MQQPDHRQPHSANQNVPAAAAAEGEQDPPPPPPPTEQFSDELLEWAFREVEAAAGLDEDGDLPPEERLGRLWAVGRRAGMIGSDQRDLQDILASCGVTEEQWILDADEHQVAAIEAVLTGLEDGGWTLITGMAGTGKSFVLCVLYHLLQTRGEKVLLCAATNAAAEVLRSRGWPAMTVNSALGLGYHDDHTFEDIYSWLFNSGDKRYYAHEKVSTHV